jgi:hypothetical protein
MEEDKLKIEWKCLVSDIEFKLDRKVHYDDNYCKNLIFHCSINKLLKDCNEELLKHDSDYWVELIYEQRKFIFWFLEVYKILKDFYSIPENIIDTLKINYFSEVYKQNLSTTPLKDVVDEVLIKHYGVTNPCIYKIGIKDNDVVQVLSINYIKAKNPVEARLEAEKKFGFSEKTNDQWMFSGNPMYVFVEQILDVNLEYEKINEIYTDVEAILIRKNLLKERLKALIQEISSF